MAGNSWLTQTQWFCAAEKPPHLTCLAPSEGWSDFYNNDTIQRGGIPYAGFWNWLMTKCTIGLGKFEDVKKMAESQELWNDYWEDRRARLDQIEVPMLVVASWTSALHTGGTFHLYYGQNVEDTRKFFDHYMKDENNGWEFTPRVRLCILNPGGRDIVNRPEAEFPLAREKSRKLFLDASSCTMVWSGSQPPTESVIHFDAKTRGVAFDFEFTEKTELTGYFATRLWVEAIESNDMDLFCQWNKVDRSTGEILEHLNIDTGYLQPNPEIERQAALSTQLKNNPVFSSGGGSGRLRVSHRQLTAGSTESNPVHEHRTREMLSPGEIIAADIELRPYGTIFEAGQKLRLEITGYNTSPELLWLPPVHSINKGKIAIHTGGRFDSYLLVPCIPESQTTEAAGSLTS